MYLSGKAGLARRFGFGDNLCDGGFDHPHFDILGQFDLDLVVVLDLDNLADQPALGDDLVTAAQGLDHRLMLLHFFLLGSDQQEVHDRKYQEEREKLGKRATVHGVTSCLGGRVRPANSGGTYAFGGTCARHLAGQKTGGAIDAHPGHTAVQPSGPMWRPGRAAPEGHGEGSRHRVLQDRYRDPADLSRALWLGGHRGGPSAAGGAGLWADAARRAHTAPLQTLQARFGLTALNPGLFLLLTSGVIWLIGQTVLSGIPSEDAGWRDWRFTLTKVTALTAVLGAVLVFPFTLVRLSLARDLNRHAENVLFNEKINVASASLYATRQITRSRVGPQEAPILHDHHEDDIVRRNAAIDALEGLGDQRPEVVPRIARMLSVYVRELSREHPAEPVPEESERRNLRAWTQALPLKRSDMQTAVQALGRMRQKHATRFAEERIDLSGANLQAMDLRGIYSALRAASCSARRFRGTNLLEPDLKPVE